MSESEQYCGATILSVGADMDLTHISSHLQEELSFMEDAKERVFTAANATMIHVWNIGQLLCQAKEQVMHGEWQNWMADHGLNARSANRHMRVFKHYPDVYDLVEQNSGHDPPSSSAIPHASPALWLSLIHI